MNTKDEKDPKGLDKLILIQKLLDEGKITPEEAVILMSDKPKPPPDPPG